MNPWLLALLFFVGVAVAAWISFLIRERCPECGRRALQTVQSMRWDGPTGGGWRTYHVCESCGARLKRESHGAWLFPSEEEWNEVISPAPSAAVERSNTIAARLAQVLANGEPLRCPHCRRATRDMRYVEMPTSESYFVCRQCGRSFDGAQSADAEIAPPNEES